MQKARICPCALVADAHAGMRAGLHCRMQPKGTHDGTGGLREQGGTTGGYRYGVGAHLKNPPFSRSAGGALDQAVEDVDPPFGSRMIYMASKTWPGHHQATLNLKDFYVIHSTPMPNHVPRYSGVDMSAYDTVRKSILTVGASNQLLGPFLGCSRRRLGAANIASRSRVSAPDR